MKYIRCLLVLLLVICACKELNVEPQLKRAKIEIIKLQHYEAIFSDGTSRHMYLGRVKNSGTFDAHPIRPRILVWRGTGRDTLGIPDEIIYGWLGTQQSQLWSGVINATDQLRAGEELDFNVSTRVYPLPLLKIKFEMDYERTGADPPLRILI